MTFWSLQNIKLPLWPYIVLSYISINSSPVLSTKYIFMVINFWSNYQKVHPAFKTSIQWVDAELRVRAHGDDDVHRVIHGRFDTRSQQTKAYKPTYLSPSQSVGCCFMFFFHILKPTRTMLYQSPSIMMFVSLFVCLFVCLFDGFGYRSILTFLYERRCIHV